jgi:ASC-1-like (ASCH) protein
MTVSFPIQREWFEEIQSGEKRVEYRACSEHWEARLGPDRVGEEIVFQCGQDVLRGRVTDVERVETPEWVPAECVETAECFAVHFTLSSQA